MKIGYTIQIERALMRYRVLIILAMLSAIVGCSRKEEPAGLGREAAPAAAMSAPAAPGQAAAKRRTMAYEHLVRLDAAEDKVPGIHQSAEAACRAAVEDQCEILESSLNTGRHVNARLKFRAKPAGIQKLLAALGAQGNVVSHSTTAEDLAGPLADNDKKLEMLLDYRAKLEALRTRAASDIDALIKVNKELAQVQSEIEAASGEKARLNRRVDTEILMVDISPDHSQSFWRPIGDALTDFGGNLSHGVSSVVTGLAYLLPWGLTLGALVWVVRKLWRRRRKEA